MKRELGWLIAGVLAVFLVAGGVHSCGQEVLWQARVRQVESKVKALRVVADLATEKANKYAAAALRRQPVIAGRASTVARVDSLRPPADTCDPNIAARDSLIIEQAYQISDLSAANRLYRASNDTLTAVNDSLSGVLAARPKRAPFQFTLEGGLGPSCVLVDGRVRCEALSLHVTVVRFKLL